jgi:hypothetical protein
MLMVSSTLGSSTTPAGSAAPGRRPFPCARGTRPAWWRRWHVQLAAGQHRLEHVAGVHGAFGRAGPDDGVQLVDKEHDLPLGVGDLFQDRLEALLELAAELGAGDHGPQVELHEALVLQPLGHVAADDALGQALDDGRLARAGLADQHRVVLGAAAEDLDDAPDLFVAADDRVELALARQLRQVAPIALQRLVGALGVLRGDALAAADALQGAQIGIAAQPVALQELGHASGPLFQEGQEQVLGGDIVVAELARDLFGPFQALS